MFKKEAKEFNDVLLNNIQMRDMERLVRRWLYENRTL